MIYVKNHYLFILLLASVLLYKNCASFELDELEFIENGDHEFDVLIFTQRWPITGCIEWMDEKRDNTCLLPSQKDIWTIHGIWPTRFGSIGPAFCNKTAKFDIDTLKPFIDQLSQFWLNIEKGTPRASLWKHEWLKHGTCAMVLAELETENKYFGQGLAWLQQYAMSSVLDKFGIKSGNNYTIIDIHHAIITVLNRNPSIHCVKEKETNKLFLSEIRICFTKKLELIDCDGVVENRYPIYYRGGNVITNCDLNRAIEYPSVVPKYLLDRTPSRSPSQSAWQFPLVNIYKLIQLIQWFTL